MMQLRRYTLCVFLVVSLLVLSAGCTGKEEQYNKRVHSHLKHIYLALAHYADLHNGRFPDGGQNYADSLGILAKAVDINLSLYIAGPNRSRERVIEKIESGVPLKTDDISWHYTPGLSITDDKEIAVIWEKDNKYSNHSVMLFIDGQRDTIDDVDWQSFIKKQELLLSNRSKRLDLPDSEREEHP